MSKLQPNNRPHFLIVSGDGINCERETAQAFNNAGANTTIIHINDLLEQPNRLNHFHGLALPGGFSFGDELGSGQVLAVKIKHGLGEEFAKFVADQKPIIGICNGFQVLVKLGLLPSPNYKRSMALAHNDTGKFINCWTELLVNKDSVCRWTTLLKNFDTINLPIRHAEGQIVFSNVDLYLQLANNGQIPFYYKNNVNGSYMNIAGVCDSSGTILGMMPHPEAYLYQVTAANHGNHKDDIFSKGTGQLLFDSIVQYLRNS